ncbi:MAG TPA: M56 family metallopeptidase [Vicinamibacteria bacterium]|nr:M56 family metallopeptidase [Vicinamibacteria bacterium]
MSFALLGLGLAFALFAAGSSALAVVVGLAFPFLDRATRKADPRTRASVLFALGVLPALGGTVLALGLVLPAWLLREPREAREGAGPALVLLASAGLLLVLLRLGSALRDYLRTAETVREWTAQGRPLGGLPLAATRFPHDFPVAALTGWRRPRLLLADRLMDALLPDELEAVVAHELSHLEARDNLKRLLLRAVPDPLAYCAAGARLRQAFEEASEAGADASAAHRVPPLRLASALVKVAALVPPGRRLELGLVALHHEGSLAARVGALLEAHDRTTLPDPPGSRWLRGAGMVALTALALLGIASSAFPLVHDALEGLVHLLS